MLTGCYPASLDNMEQAPYNKLMTKTPLPIDSATLPPWARWLAQDADGAWWAYEHEPNEGAVSWYENEVGDAIRVTKDHPNSGWRGTLTRIR